MMEKLNLAYSTNNKLIPTEKNYRLKLIERTDLFIKKFRWKAIFYDMKFNNKSKNNNNINYNTKDNSKNNGDGTLKKIFSRLWNKK